MPSDFVSCINLRSTSIVSIAKPPCYYYRYFSFGKREVRDVEAGETKREFVVFGGFFSFYGMMGKKLDVFNTYLGRRRGRGRQAQSLTVVFVLYD